MAIDPESRLVLVVVPGPRDVEAAEEVVGEVKDRTGGRVLDLATSDEYPAYRTALLNAYGEEVTTTATGRRSRKMVAEKLPPPGMNYATVEKRRVRGRVVEIGDAGGLRDDGRRGGGAGKIDRESTDQHLVRGASERDGPSPERPEGAEDLHILEGLGGACGDDLFHDLSREFLLAGENIERTHRRGTLAAEDARDGGRTGQSRLDDSRMDHDVRRSTKLRHDQLSRRNQS